MRYAGHWCTFGSVYLGLKVPQYVSIAEFDDIDFAAYSYPPLTTVRVTSYEIGRLVAKYLIDAIAQKSLQLRHYCLDTDLIIRNSCRQNYVANDIQYRKKGVIHNLRILGLY